MLNIFSSAIHVTVDVDESLRTTTSIELQKLSVMPQTIFLRAPLGDSSSRSSRLVSIQKGHTDLSFLRSPVLGTPRSNRTQSIDTGAGIAPAPFEDLRRRLAMINNSGTSLPMSPNTREPRSPIHPVPELISRLTMPETAVSDVPHPIERPASPSESLLSVANSTYKGATQFLHAGGDGQKAAPAVGSSKANATGVLDTHSKSRSEEVSEVSGRSSPVSVAGTIRGLERPRVVSLAPISTYGELSPPD